METVTVSSSLLEEQKTNVDVDLALQLRLKNTRTTDTELLSVYEQSYRKKWKELQEQLEQEVAEEKERLRKRLEEEQDVERQCQLRFEDQKRNLQKTINERREQILRIHAETAELEKKGKRLLPGKTDNVAGAIRDVAVMLREVQKELKSRPTTARSGECIVCSSNLRDVVFLPCRHFVLCGECGGKVTACPLCRHTIEDRIKVLSA